MVTWSNISLHLYCKNVYTSVHNHHIALYTMFSSQLDKNININVHSLPTGSAVENLFIFPVNETSPMCRKWSKLNVVSQEQLVILTNHSRISGQGSTNHRAWIVWHNHTTTQPHNYTQSKCRSPSAFCCRTWKCWNLLHQSTPVKKNQICWRKE